MEDAALFSASATSPVSLVPIPIKYTDSLVSGGVVVTHFGSSDPVVADGPEPQAMRNPASPAIEAMMPKHNNNVRFIQYLNIF